MTVAKVTQKYVGIGLFFKLCNNRTIVGTKLRLTCRQKSKFSNYKSIIEISVI